MATAAIHIGLISDTHGLMRPSALAALAGSDAIVHAGDIGKPAVLEALAAIAPVTVVRGNNDKGAWCREIPETAAVEFGDAWLYVLHDLAELDLDPAGTFAAVVVGHSHRPSVTERDGVLYINPGSAGPRRFKLPICVARMTIVGGTVTAEIVELSG